MQDGGLEIVLSRPFLAGELAFLVATADLEDQQLIENMFHDLPSPEGSAHDLEMFSLIREGGAEGDRRWNISGPRIVGDVALESLSTALTTLMAGLNLSALDSEPSRLHLHAAAAARADGRSVVIAAPRNTGKTTTVAHLVRRGWRFITDETVGLGSDGREIGGFQKPLSIKPGGFEHIPHLEQFAVPPAPSARNDEFRFVSMGKAGATVVATGQPHIIVLLRRGTSEASPEPTFRSLNPADAVVALMQETLDADRFGPSSVGTLVQFAASCHSYEVVIGEPARTAELIEQLASVEPVVPAVTARNPDSSRLAPGVLSYRVGDRTVAYESTSGRILALDEPATMVWETLAGWKAHPEIDLNGPVIATFVAQLIGLELLLPYND